MRTKKKIKQASGSISRKKCLSTGWRINITSLDMI
jgi:hypothetical protein